MAPERWERGEGRFCQLLYLESWAAQKASFVLIWIIRTRRNNREINIKMWDQNDKLDAPVKKSHGQTREATVIGQNYLTLESG